MTTVTTHQHREWTGYDWASVHPVQVEPDVPRWSAIQWVGDQGRGAPSRPTTQAEAPHGEAGFSGFGHNPGGNHWAEGYQH